MNFRDNIRKILFITFWCIIGVGMVVLLQAAIKIKNQKSCAGFNLEIVNSNNDQQFIDKREILRVLTKNGTQHLKGRNVRSFDLKEMEKQLKTDAWIRDAELFFDNNCVLQIKIDERKPIARIFTSSGESFYIDSTRKRLPLSKNTVAKLPVFTGFPSGARKLKARDSVLLEEIRKLSWYILHDPFWMAQIAQIDITSKRTFEMVPTIGNHIIEFGDGSNCEKKFNKLLLFYQDVLSKVGMEKYSRLNIQYRQQVIGVKQNAYVSQNDSLQAIKNIEQMIAAAQTKYPLTAKNDSAMQFNKQLLQQIKTSVTNVKTSNKSVMHPAGVPIRSASAGANEAPGKNPYSVEPVKPKAIMPRKS